MSREASRQNFTMVAKTFAGLEEALADELKSLGAENVKVVKRAVVYQGDTKLLYESNLKLRCALRILKHVSEFEVKNEKDLYKAVRSIDWSKFISVDDTFAVDGVVHSRFFKHSKYAALKAKDAIADQFRDKYRKRPSVNVDNPTLRINLHIDDRRLTVSLDSSGESLHRRGYRIEKTKAPLNEALAAGMILLTGWDGSTTFVDPMCGSGTIPIEAAMIATNTPPGLLRNSFGFMKWKDYNKKLWHTIKTRAEDEVSDCNSAIVASDISKLAVETASKNAARAGMTKSINLLNVPYEKLEPPRETGVVVMNPPYGERLKVGSISELYGLIGSTLKHSYEGYEAWILSSNREALKKIGLKTSKRITLFNGPLESKFYNYSLYKGSKKNKPEE